MTDYKNDLMYAMWRFDMWHQGGNGTYQDIDRAVETGHLIPGRCPRPESECSCTWQHGAYND